MAITYEWRGAFENDEVNLLHAEAFETGVFGEDDWYWTTLTSAHSLGWSPRETGTRWSGSSTSCGTVSCTPGSRTRRSP